MPYEAVDSPCDARIVLPSGVATPTLGGPFDIVVSTTPLAVPLPETAPRMQPLKSGGAGVTGRAMVGIYTLMDMTQAWLVVSWRHLDDNIDSGFHHQSLLLHETHPFVSSFPTHISVQAMWKDPQTLGLFRAYVRKRNVRDIYRDEGNPEQEGSWLASRLAPRLCGAAFRRLDPFHLQLWVRL